MTVLPSLSTRYLIQKKHFSFRNRYVITDDAGVIHYKASSKFLALDNKFLICDADEKPLIRIHQDLNFRPAYKLFSLRYGINEQIATVKRTGSIGQRKLEIKSNNGEYIMQKKSDGSSNEFTITKDGQIVAITSKDASLTDSFYWVDIFDNDEEDHALVLAMVIILSCTCHSPIYSVPKTDDDQSNN